MKINTIYVVCIWAKTTSSRGSMWFVKFYEDWKRCVAVKDALSWKHETNRFEFVFILFIFTVHPNTLHLDYFFTNESLEMTLGCEPHKITDTFYGAYWTWVFELLMCFWFFFSLSHLVLLFLSIYSFSIFSREAVNKTKKNTTTDIRR